MNSLPDGFVQGADWKKEKHVPVIEAPSAAKVDEAVRIKCSVGKEIAHPNTTEHHIAWMELYFQPDGEKFPYLVGRTEFAAHGASTNGPNTSSVFAPPDCVFAMRTAKPGKLVALSYCNIHGLWSSTAALTVS